MCVCVCLCRLVLRPLLRAKGGYGEQGKKKKKETRGKQDYIQTALDNLNLVGAPPPTKDPESTLSDLCWMLTVPRDRDARTHARHGLSGVFFFCSLAVCPVAIPILSFMHACTTLAPVRTLHRADMAAGMAALPASSKRPGGVGWLSGGGAGGDKSHAASKCCSIHSTVGKYAVCNYHYGVLWYYQVGRYVH